MGRTESALWTIEELGERVGQALSLDYAGQRNGQVSEVPNLRTIRYYTTLGLLDRPAQMRGRTALYGHKHLQQIVAIKRLQAEGLSLQQVQERLAGVSTRALAAIAALPESLPPPSVEPDEKPVRRRRDEAFWSVEVEAPVAAPTHLISVPLHADVSLSVTTSRALTTEDVAAVRQAAATLLKTLEERGLITTKEPA